MTPQLAEAIAIIVAKYGPELALALIDIFKKQDATLDDLRAVLSTVKPYEAYAIPAYAVPADKPTVTPLQP